MFLLLIHCQLCFILIWEKIHPLKVIERKTSVCQYNVIFLYYYYIHNFFIDFTAFGLLNSLGIALKQLACELHVAVVMVNLATMWREDDDESSCEREQELKPAFGKLWLSVPNLRLCLMREEDGGNCVKLSVMKSTRISSNRSCKLKFTIKGLE